MEKIDKIREFFKKDAYAMELGAKIEEIKEDSALCSFKINEKHFNAGGLIQGGAIFTLMDFCFAVASNSRGKLTVSVNNNISFMGKSEGDKIYARATLIKELKKMVYYDVKAFDEKDNVIAVMQVTGYKKDIDNKF